MELSVLKALLEAWEIDIPKLAQEDGLDERIKAQKLVYLLQNAVGRQLYEYNIYVHGPYAPLLSRDYYGLASTHYNQTCATSDIGTLFGSRPAEVKTDATAFAADANLLFTDALELLSTTLFVSKRYRREDELKGAVRKFKSQFADEQVDSALRFLTEKEYCRTCRTVVSG